MTAPVNEQPEPRFACEKCGKKLTHAQAREHWQKHEKNDEKKPEEH